MSWKRDTSYQLQATSYKIKDTSYNTKEARYNIAPALADDSMVHLCTLEIVIVIVQLLFKTMKYVFCFSHDGVPLKF